MLVQMEGGFISKHIFFRNFVLRLPDLKKRQSKMYNKFLSWLLHATEICVFNFQVFNDLSESVLR